MPKAAHSFIRVILIAPILLCLPIVAAAQQNRECPRSAAEYAGSGYKIKEIRIDTPLQLFNQLKSKVAEIKADLAQPEKYSNAEAKASPLIENKAFNAASWSEGAQIVRAKFEDNTATIGRLRAILVLPRLRGCQASDVSFQGAPTLAVEFKVYTTEYLDYLSSIYEGQEHGLSRSVLLTPLTKFLSVNSPQPYAGFNRSRAMFGGASLVSRSDNPLINRISMDASGSSSSAQANINLWGSRDFNATALGHAEWLSGYRYSDIPSAPADLKEGRMVAQFIGATKPLGKLKLILRYGTSVEGGNKQTDINPNLLPPGALTSAGYGAVKLFGGGSFHTGKHDFTASYGTEIGGAKSATESDRKIDYLKHLVDLGYSLRFLPWLHKPITLETRFTAGVLDARGPIPLGARFFGGNVEQNFISSDDWIIRSNPFIRSFAQNQFTPSGGGALVGGDKFYSINVAFAFTVWGRPMVPRDVLDSPAFLPTVKGAFFTIEEATRKARLADSAVVTAYANSLLNIDEASVGQKSPLTTLKNTLAQFKLQFAGDQAALEIIDEAVFSIEDLQSRLASLKIEVEKKGDVIFQLQSLTKDFTSCTDFDDIPSGAATGGESLLHLLAFSLQDLIQLLDDRGVPTSDQRRREIEMQKVQLDALYKEGPCKYSLLVQTNVDCSCQQSALDEQTKQSFLNAQSEAQRAARETIAPARDLFDRLTKELNLIAVSPLFLYDTARSRSKLTGLTSNAARHGLGGGVRVSVVNLDLDLGYSFNIHRQPREKRGAFVFSLRINDLLR